MTKMILSALFEPGPSRLDFANADKSHKQQYHSPPPQLPREKFLDVHLPTTLLQTEGLMPSTKQTVGLSHRGQNAGVHEQVAGGPEESVPNTSSPTRKYVPGIEQAGRVTMGMRGKTRTTVG